MAENGKRVIYKLNYKCSCGKLNIDTKTEYKVQLASHFNSILSHAENTPCEVIDLIAKVEKIDG